MKVFLAGIERLKKNQEEIKGIRYWLESFIYFEEWMAQYFACAKEVLIDSGAFTFLSRNGGNVNFENYLYKYIDFINKYKIEHFFELDVDEIVGLNEVERYRKILERETGKRCIPVWHKSRGKQYFTDLVKEYDRIAIGGIVTKEIPSKQWPYFSFFLDEAHKNKCQVHGLGFTSLSRLNKYPFDSVDSTSWTSGARFGIIYKFTGNTLIIYRNKQKRVKDGDLVNTHNLREWIKYQKYMDTRRTR